MKPYSFSNDVHEVCMVSFLPLKIYDVKFEGWCSHHCSSSVFSDDFWFCRLLEVALVLCFACFGDCFGERVVFP